MSFRVLAWLPVAAAALFAAIAFSMGEARFGGVLQVADQLAKLVAAGGCVAAALSFERGDYLRRAWWLDGACYVLLWAASALAALVAHGVPLPAAPVSVARFVMVTGGNVCSTAGTWMMARAWTVAGLEDDPDARSRRRLLFVSAMVGALLITGTAIKNDIRAFLETGGNLHFAWNMASDVGDTAALALLVPVLQTVRALRGGVLRWPWGLLAASVVAWLVYDATSNFTYFSHATALPVLVASESLRVLACGLGFSAGLAQRRVVAVQ